MARYVHREVADVRKDPTEGAEIRLLLGVHGSTNDVIERVRTLGGTLVEDLPFDSLLVDVPESSVDELCDLKGVESVELDEGMETLAGN